jgi:Glycoside hydrolase family 5 C-terminal domain
MNFDADKRHFRLEWTVDGTIDQPTEIFVPKLHYPTGFDVRVADGLKWTYSDVDFVLSIVVDASRGGSPPTTAFVAVTPKVNRSAEPGGSLPTKL